MKVWLWLTVVDGLHADQIVGAVEKLWRRELETNQAPAVGDRVILWGNSEEGPHGGPLWDIRRRYWDAAGDVHCDLVRMVINPNSAAHRAMQLAASHGDRESAPWWTATDGDPRPLMVAGGWTDQ